MVISDGWKKVKTALGMNMCFYVPRADQGEPSAAIDVARRISGAVIVSSPAVVRHQTRTPSPSSSRLLLSRSGSKSSKKTCSICLTSIKPGQGQAIFTAECSHSFHFNCITSNVKHGNQICPVCRAKWKEVPFQSPDTDVFQSRRSRINPLGRALDDAHLMLIRRLPQPRLVPGQPDSSVRDQPEPSCFDDDEALDSELGSGQNNLYTVHNQSGSSIGLLEVKTYPEVPAVCRSTCHDNFTVLIHLKAPKANILNASQDVRQSSRASVDLVTVLDVSGSMAGTKLALLKRAMGFVVQNLGPTDRLSVVAFSSMAHRLFPLRRMTNTGKQEALQAINSLFCNGGTNIAEGLRKAFKIMSDRKWNNQVASVMLLSDGQDTYNINTPSSGSRRSLSRVDSRSLLPASVVQQNDPAVSHIPVHTFGFGTDHDAASMHSVSEISGGTFSFVESESVIQDAFAQCIGGLLSVVIQELKVEIQSRLQLRKIKAGSYQSSLGGDGLTGLVMVGDLYAEEERDFLVTVNIPVDQSGQGHQTLLNVTCVYKDPISKDTVRLGEVSEVTIERPEETGELPVSMEVDRQRNRLYAAEAMAEARVAAERGDLSTAISGLEVCNRALSESASARASDRLCISLCTELKEMQQRMANRRVYEASGRAYVLSGLSSHSWQRATARGDSTNTNSLVQAYQTPSMVDMVTQSQTMIFREPLASSHGRRHLRHALSFPSGPQPRLESKIDDAAGIKLPFCGEELLTWSLHPRLSAVLPSSTRTVGLCSQGRGPQVRGVTVPEAAQQAAQAQVPVILIPVTDTGCVLHTGSLATVQEEESVGRAQGCILFSCGQLGIVRPGLKAGSQQNNGRE
ncbi:hypothetical protein SAY86_014109 [Trapa natans]|uniref:Uncharacterized protein n=1 Tax=Trapa natans TaxID=22666 RepID=A0AAN7KVS3_TRANT|nr:hypothetical protein SAY86_014109 [Trapa natans]